MSIPASVMMKLATLGLSAEQAQCVATMLTEVESATKAEADSIAEKSREQTRVRVQKWREKKKVEAGGNVTERYDTLRNGSREGVARGEINSSNKKISGQEENKEDAPKARVRDLADFKAALSELDAERIEAIVKHRRSKRGQLTGHAAKLFIADAATCGMSLAAAVDTCISRNWITVKPEYLRDRRQATAPPRGGKETPFDALDDISRMKGWDHEPAGLPGSSEDVERLPASGGGRHSGPSLDLRRGHDWHLRSGDM